MCSVIKNVQQCRESGRIAKMKGDSAESARVGGQNRLVTPLLQSSQTEWFFQKELSADADSFATDPRTG